jgi:chaperonin cofactor prefoldin
MKGNDIMKLISKILGGVGAVGVVTAGTLILTSNMNVKGEDAVTMELFNQLKTKVETLETQNTELSNKIIELANADVVINTKIGVETEKVKTELNAKINTNTTNITSVTSRTTKIEAREDKLYNTMSTYYPHETTKGTIMKDFKASQ